MMEPKMELLIFPWFVFWLAFSVIVGVFASQRRNRSGFGWFVLALLISPVLAFLLCAAMKEAAPRDPITARPIWHDLLFGRPGQPVTIAPKRPRLSSDNWSRLKAKTDW
jgi:hypothetical protein